MIVCWSLSNSSILPPSMLECRHAPAAAHYRHAGRIAERRGGDDIVSALGRPRVRGRVRQESESAADQALDLGNGVKLDMMLIPAGKFMMGTPEPTRGLGFTGAESANYASIRRWELRKVGAGTCGRLHTCQPSIIS